MTRKKIYKLLTEIFRSTFNDGQITVTPEMTAKDIEDWDSLSNIDLIVSLEQCFQIKFTVGEITHMKNVGEMVELIMERY